MSTTKKISFVVVVLVVIGGIWYLESLKVHPRQVAGAQAINISNTPSRRCQHISAAPKG